MVEIEIGVLRSQCLDRGIADSETLASEIAVWQQQRNASGARIQWMFNAERAPAENGAAVSQPTHCRATGNLNQSESLC